MTQRNTQRTYKSRLLIALFENKEELLTLYNAVRRSNYTNTDDLIVNTIEDVIYLGMKNDISFLFEHRLNLYEHQSSWNPNMPLRGLFYLASLYRQYVAEHQLDLYASTLLRLPAPQYVVFFECVATVLNINLGNNRELMERCRTLYEYACT